MIKETEITIDGAIINIAVDFQYFKEEGEVIIQIESIMNGKMDVTEILSEEQLEDIKWECQKHYENTAFDYWEQRYEERNSGLDWRNL